MCTPKELVPDVLPRGDNLGVDLGVFWGCSGVVLGLFWGCSGFEALVKHPETGHGPF